MYQFFIICENCKAKLLLQETQEPKKNRFIICSVCKKPTFYNDIDFNVDIAKYKQSAQNFDSTKTPDIIDIEQNNAYNVDKFLHLDKFAFLEYYDLRQSLQKSPLVSKNRILVGRNSREKPADVQIFTTDNYMNRQHFWIEVEKRQGLYTFILQDNNSTNGTFLLVNGAWKRVCNDFQPYIKHGDVIGAGRTKIVFKVMSLS